MYKKYTHPQPDCPGCGINQGLIQRAVDEGINVCPKAEKCTKFMSVYLQFGQGGKPLDQFTREQIVALLDEDDAKALGK